MKNHIPPTNIFFGEIAIKNLLKKEKKMREAWTLLEAAGLLEEAKYLIKEAVQTAVLEDNYNNEDFS